jgi:hypothetical protein
MDASERCRLEAKKCRELASETKDDKQRADLIGIARTYDMLAGQIERLKPVRPG